LLVSNFAGSIHSVATCWTWFPYPQSWLSRLTEASMRTRSLMIRSERAFSRTRVFVSCNSGITRCWLRRRQYWRGFGMNCSSGPHPHPRPLL